MVTAHDHVLIRRPIQSTSSVSKISSPLVAVGEEEEEEDCIEKESVSLRVS